MEIKIERKDEKRKVDTVFIYIGDDKYTLKETVDGRLQVNKVSESGNNDYLKIHPRTGNEIELS